MRVLRIMCIVLSILWLAAGMHAQAQDPTAIPLSPEQQNLLSQIDAADADQGNWQSYKTISFNTQFYSETLVVSPGNTVTTQRTTNFTITSSYQGNPRNPVYRSDSLLTIENTEQKLFSSGQQLAENYTLLAEVLYAEGRLYVQALRNGGSEALPPMPEPIWLDVTQDLDQFPALQLVTLRRYMPTAALPTVPNPLQDVDFVGLIHDTSLRDLVADITLVADNEVLADGLNAGLAVRQIRIQLNPLVVLTRAYAEFPNGDGLVAAFVNEGVDMALTVWLDAQTSRRVREQFIFVIQGSPDPAAFGLAPGDLGEGGSLAILFQLESDISYTDINVPVEINAPVVQ